MSDPTDTDAERRPYGAGPAYPSPPHVSSPRSLPTTRYCRRAGWMLATPSAARLATRTPAHGERPTAAAATAPPAGDAGALLRTEPRVHRGRGRARRRPRLHRGVDDGGLRRPQGTRLGRPGRSAHPAPGPRPHGIQPRRARRHLGRRDRPGGGARSPRAGRSGASDGWSSRWAPTTSPSGMTLARSRLNLANVLDEATTAASRRSSSGSPRASTPSGNPRIEALAEAQADVCARRGGHLRRLLQAAGRPRAVDRRPGSASPDRAHPGQAGYGLVAWLVLHNGWNDWMRISS